MSGQRTDERPRVAFVSWERHRRTREVASALKATLAEVSSSWPRPWRYAPLLADTIRGLARLRPEVLFVQCPSVILAALAVVVRPLFGYRLVLDLHNEAVEPFNYPGRFSKAVLAALWRCADVCVVTNESLAKRLEGHARHVAILPDRIPTFANASSGPGARQSTVVFICTYAADEPYLEVIEAARLLPPSTRLFITGNPPASGLPVDLPANVTLCGFLPLPEYEDLLHNADVLVDLTSMENCLVCGAYEAVGLAKPLVTSDTAALRSHFSLGTVYTKHLAAELAEAIRRALRDRDRLAEEMRQLRPRLIARWELAFNALVDHVYASAGHARTPQ